MRSILFACLVLAPVSAWAQINLRNVPAASSLGANDTVLCSTLVGGRLCTPSQIFSKAGPGAVLSGNPAGAPLTHSTGERFGASFRIGSMAAYSILTSVFGNAPPIQDGVQGVVVLPAGSTVLQANALAGYVRVETPTALNGAGQVGVAVGGIAESTVDGAAVWGDAIALQDSGAGTGAGRRLVGSERDFNVQKPGTVATGYLVTGLSQVAPAAGSASFVAGRANGAKANIYWPVGFQSVDNANTRALEVGTSRDVGELSVNSQLVVFRATNAAGAAAETYLFSNAGGLAVEGLGVRDLRVTNGALSATNGLRFGSGAQAIVTADAAGTTTVTAPNVYLTGALLPTGGNLLGAGAAAQRWNISASNINLSGQAQMSADGKAILYWDAATSKLRFAYNGVQLWSVDTSGNVRALGTITGGVAP